MKTKLVAIVSLAALSLSAAPVTKHISDFDTTYGMLIDKDHLLCADFQTICGDGWCVKVPAKLITATKYFSFERLNHMGAAYMARDSNVPATCEAIEQLRSSNPNGLQVRVKESLDEIVQEFSNGTCGATLREEISIWLSGHEYVNTAEVSLGQVPCK